MSATRMYYDTYNEQISRAFEKLQNEVENDKKLIEQQKTTIEKLHYTIKEKYVLDKKYKELLDSEKQYRHENGLFAKKCAKLAQELDIERKKSPNASTNIRALEMKIAELEAKLKNNSEELQRRAAAEHQLEIADLKKKHGLELQALKAKYDHINNRNQNQVEVVIFAKNRENAANGDNNAENMIKDLEAEIKLLKNKSDGYEKTIKEMSSKGLAYSKKLTSLNDMMKDMMANGKQEKTMIERMRSLDAVRVTEIGTIKRRYEGEVAKLTKQKKYQMELNQKLKKKLLATQYSFGGHEMLRKATAHQLTTMYSRNNRNMIADLKRSLDQAMSYVVKKYDEQNANSRQLVDESAQSQIDCIHKNAKEIVKITPNCPDCMRPFDDIASLKKHMTLYHMKQYSDDFNGPIVVERSAKRKRTAKGVIDVDDDVE